MVGGDLEGMVRLKISRRLALMSSAAETSHAICSTEIGRDWLVRCRSLALRATRLCRGFPSRSIPRLARNDRVYPLTRDTGLTKFVIDEFGVGMLITITIAAIIICRTSASARTA